MNLYAGHQQGREGFGALQSYLLFYSHTRTLLSLSYAHHTYSSSSFRCLSSIGMLSSIPSAGIASHRPPPPQHLAESNGNTNSSRLLTELIAAEDQYIEKIAIIDEANKEFVTLSTLNGHHAQSTTVLGDVLVQWLDKLKGPYSKYLRNDDAIARDLNHTPVHHHLAGLSPPTTLCSLLEGPVRQLDHYKKFIIRSTRPSRPSHVTKRHSAD
ncbi:hypothetical protein BX666DRAFT_1108302 [Dichotomocladium elegans]|nr:hypothetical protein BX666DRAFT_1108302 [Dichotomocladium elegans]